MPNSSSSPVGARPMGKRSFPLSADQREAAQTWVEFGARTPSKPRQASSVVLLKDSPSGLQTFLTYRPGGSPLGAVAFPGGTIEAADDDVTDWVGPSPAVWAKSLGTADIGLAKRHVVAAIRETFEETGILLAGPDASSLVENNSGPEWMRARESIAGQETTFATLLERYGLALRTDLLKPLSHWLSPDFAHRRFDTRYFAAATPINQQPSLLDQQGCLGAVGQCRGHFGRPCHHSPGGRSGAAAHGGADPGRAGGSRRGNHSGEDCCCARVHCVLEPQAPHQRIPAAAHG